jgi:hypothetical protein
MKMLDYQEQIDNLFNVMKSKKEIVLATTDGKAVSARTVYCVSNGRHVYFLTSKAYRKHKQIKCNNNVALCTENIQIEGVASELGHPNSECNKEIISFMIDYVGTQKFMRYKNTVLYDVEIKKIEVWVNGKRMFLDVEKQECYMR